MTIPHNHDPAEECGPYCPTRLYVSRARNRLNVVRALMYRRAARMLRDDSLHGDMRVIAKARAALP